MKRTDGAECDEVFLSTQMHGYLLADRQRRPLTRYISWQDTRAANCGISVEIGQESGTAKKDKLPRAGVAAIARMQPELYARAAEFFTLGSYLAYAFTGKNATHITDAAASGFYNVKQKTAVACSLTLPEALWDVAPVGTYRGMRVFAPIGDQQCAVLGAGGDEQTLVLNLGTAAQMCAIEREFAVGAFESRPYFGGRTLCTVTGLSGGKRLNACSDTEEQAVRLAEEYLEAVRRLPARDRMLVTGGAFSYHRALLTRALDRMGIPYTVNEEADTLAGLKKVAEKER